MAKNSGSVSILAQVQDFIVGAGKSGVTMSNIWAKFHDVQCPKVLRALVDLVVSGRITKITAPNTWESDIYVAL